MRNFFSLHLDSIGFSASLLCAIHCSAVPLLLTISTWSGLQILNDPSIELTVLCISAVLALLSIFPSYYRYHKNRSAIVVVFLGFVLMSAGQLCFDDAWETSSTSLGAIMVASAHFLNWKLCKSCQVNKTKKR